MRSLSSFIVYDLGCWVDILHGYNWLASHDLHFLYESAQVSFCAEKGCPDPQRRVHVNVAAAAPAPPSALVLMNQRKLWRLLQQVSLGAAAMAVRPSLWHPPPLGQKAAAAPPRRSRQPRTPGRPTRLRGWRMGRVCSSMMAQ